MCTVSFIPVRDTFYLTSNRDEKRTRKKANPPIAYTVAGARMIFPRDGEAGGTWIVLKENGDAAVLLNGAFLHHLSSGPYKKSRGLLLLEIMSTERPTQTFGRIDLEGIEPFTLVILEKKCLYEFRWDGQERYCKQLPTNRAHIWSSATLYDGLVSKKREQWLATFLNNTPQPTQYDILTFHQQAGEGNPEQDLLMKRSDIYSTVSITSILVNEDRATMKYLDLPQGKITEMKFNLTSILES